MAKSKKAYKLTYKFISELRNLLEGDNWTQHHQLRIDELSRSLEQTPEEMVDAKVASIRERGKKFDEKNYPKMLESFARIQETTRSEIDQLKANMEQGVYTIGVAPFYTAEDAQQMLSAAHILEVDTGAYNQDAISAIRNMLEADFSELCTAQVVSTVFTIFNEEPTLQGDTLKKIISDHELTKDGLAEALIDVDMDHPIIEILVENHKLTNIEKFEEIAQELNFISNFYQVGAFNTALFSIVASQSFNSAKSFKNFLEKFVDFSTVHLVTGSLLVQSMPKIASFTDRELDSWYELINIYGTEALHAFSKADILIDMGISVSSLAAEYDMEGVFNIINSKLSEIKFTREAENPELAALCKKYNVNEITFNRALDEIIPEQKSSDELPDISFELKLGKHTYSFEKVAPGNLEGLFLGKMTNCCQFIGGGGDSCAVDGFTRQDAGFYVIRDEKGKIKAQSYAWFGILNGNRDVMVLDSFEYLPEAKDVFLPVMKKFQSMLSEQTGLSLVVGTGSSTPPIDAVKFSDLRTRSQDLERYDRDSDEVFEITQDSSVLTPQPSCITDYDCLMKIHPRITFGKILEQYSREYSEIYTKYNFSNISNIVYLLSEEGGDVQRIIDFVSRSNQDLINSLYNNLFTSYEACKQKIAECKAQGITDPKEVVDYIFPVQPTMCVVETPEEVTLRETREAAALQDPIDQDVREAACHHCVPDQAGLELIGGSTIEQTEAFAE